LVASQIQADIWQTSTIAERLLHLMVANNM